MAADISVKKLSQGAWSAELLEPPNCNANRAILFLPGLDPVSDANSCAAAVEIARATECLLLRLDYRAVPDHSYASALQDSCAAFNWLWSEWYEPEKICLVGESKGARLVLALLEFVKTTFKRSLGPSVLLSPLLFRTKHSLGRGRPCGCHAVMDVEERDNDVVVNGSGLDCLSPTVPSADIDLRGLPPVLIQVGENEITLADAQYLLKAAKRAWLDVELDVLPGLGFGWLRDPVATRHGRQAIARISEFLIKKTDF